MSNASTVQMPGETARILRLCILGSVSILPLLVLPTMVGALVDYVQFAESTAGWVAALGSAGGASAAIVIALRIRHLDPRALAVAGLGLLAAADLASAAVAGLPLWLFLVFRVVSGIGGAAAYAAVMASIAATRDPERGYGMFMVLQFALSAVGLYGLPLVLPAIGAGGMYLGLSAAALLVLPLAASVLRRDTGAPVEAGAIEVHMLLRPAAVFALLGIGLYETANVMHFTYAERIGVGLALAGERIGEILGIATVLGIPAAFGVVWLGDRSGRLRPLMAALGLSIAALGLLLLPTGPAGYAVAMCVLSVAWAFGLPYFQAVEAHLDPGGSVVVAGGFFTSGGAALGPAIAGTLVGPGGYVGVIGFAIGLYVIVAFLMAASVRTADRT